MESNIISMEGEGIVLSQFTMDPNEVATFGVSVIRNQRDIDVVRKLKTIRLIVEGDCVYQSSDITQTLTKNSQPPKLGSPYYSKLTAGPFGCVGYFLGFNAPNVTITSIERLSFNTPSTLLFESDCIIAVLANPVRVDGKDLISGIPLKVKRGSELAVGLGNTDLMIIKYK